MLKEVPKSLGTVGDAERKPRLIPLTLLRASQACTTDDENQPVFEQIKGHRIGDDSLAGDGISSGDFFECESIFQISNIKSYHVCIVYAFPTRRKYAKHVHQNANGTVALKASNAAYEDMVFCNEEIKILAIVRKVIAVNALPP
jgi:hypothetical protein